MERLNRSLKLPTLPIFADEMHITNVIFNLMDNAVKYKRPDADRATDGEDLE